MRPVKRGAWPRDAEREPVEFKEYREAREPLCDRIDEYCAYCEMPLPHGPHVEHVLAKSRHEALERHWPNLLLTCPSCNSTKSNENIELNEYFWPNRDNTFRAFEYHRDLPPVPAAILTPAQCDIAEKTIELTGLDRIPGHPDLTDRDRRWKKRQQAWDAALKARADLEENDSTGLRRWIVESSVGRGFWSVWMTVFREDADMCRRLREAFKGTAADCWNDQGKPIHRPGGLV